VAFGGKSARNKVNDSYEFRDLANPASKKNGKAKRGENKTFSPLHQGNKRVRQGGKEEKVFEKKGEVFKKKKATDSAERGLQANLFFPVKKRYTTLGGGRPSHFQGDKDKKLSAFC